MTREGDVDLPEWPKRPIELSAADLAQWRRHHEVSQKQLAAALGVQRHTIARWETGERSMPGLWLRSALQSLETDPKLWPCAKCGHSEGLEKRQQRIRIQGARQTLTFFVCPECRTRAYTA